MRFRGILAVLPVVASVVARAMVPVQSAPPALGDAASFVVLGGTAVVNSGESRVTGNVGVSPGNTVSGFTSSMFTVGDVYRNDALARAARTDANTADTILAARTCTDTSSATEIGGRTLLPGVHCFTASAVRLTGTLILDAGGDRDAVWILRFAGTLTTADDAKVLVVGNGCDGNAFWRSAGATTIGARTTFIGNIFASSIAFQDGARLSGRALARGGAVTTNANRLSLCCAPITVTSAALPHGKIGKPYPPQLFTASGGMPPYMFRVSSGSLPKRLVLGPNGTLGGRPASPGRSQFTITATDSLGCEGTVTATIEIDCPVITLSDLPPMTQDVEYDRTILVTGIAPPHIVSDGGLPAGIARHGRRIHGTPTSPGPYTIAITVDHDSGCSVSRIFHLDCPTLTIDPDTLPDGADGVPYGPIVFSASGGTPSYTFVSSGMLPTGLILLDGTLSGMPTAGGTYDFEIRVTDKYGCPAVRAYSIDICDDDCPADVPTLSQWALLLFIALAACAGMGRLSWH